MRALKRVCVFCGSTSGNSPAYVEAARATGRMLASEQVGLVYGGGRVGLMGEVASAAMVAGGEVIGVIPQHLDRYEVAHRGVTELRIVHSMHERKAMMADLSDAFIALPGGLGTAEELFEAATWSQLGIHDKPLGILDVQGYFSWLATFLDQAIEAGFLPASHRALFTFAEDPAVLLAGLRRVPRVAVEQWLDRSQR